MTLHTRGVEQDARELSTLLGDVLAGQASLETVDRIRTGAIDYRRGETEQRTLRLTVKAIAAGMKSTGYAAPPTH